MFSEVNSHLLHGRIKWHSDNPWLSKNQIEDDGWSENHQIYLTGIAQTLWLWYC